MRTENDVRFLLGAVRDLQNSGYTCPCPRCGGEMHSNLFRNALSRYEDVYICEECGTDEAMRDYFGDATPLTKWDIASRDFSNEGLK